MRSRIRMKDYRDIRRAMRRVQRKIPRLSTLIRHGIAKRVAWGVYEIDLPPMRRRRREGAL